LNGGLILIGGYGLYYTALEFSAGLSWLLFIGTPMYLTANLLRQVRCISRASCQRGCGCCNAHLRRFAHACSSRVARLASCFHGSSLGLLCQLCKRADADAAAVAWLRMGFTHSLRQVVSLSPCR